MKIAALCVLALAGSAMAQTIDGTRDASYTNLFSQNVQTQFGDYGNPTPGGSEIDNISWQSSGGNLYLFIGGNMEANGNRLVLMFNSGAGGQSTLSGIGSGAGALQQTMDTAFGGANRFIGINNDGGSNRIYLNYGSYGGGSWSNGYAGSSVVGSAAWDVDGGDTSGLQAALNNSNTAGVTGGTGAFDPAISGLVGTGVELVIPLSWLGYTSGPINVAGWIAGGDYNYASNQFLGGFASPPQGNLGSDGNGGFNGAGANFDLNDFDGDQFVSIVPTPSAAGLLGLGALAMGRRRR